MDALKQIMLKHGEKILLGVVALLCASSIYSHISRPSDELLLPNGKTERIDNTEFKQRLGAVEKVFNSKEARREKPQAEKVSAELAKHIASKDNLTVPTGSMEWQEYCRPAPLTIPQAFREARNPDEIRKANIPAQFRTRLGNAEEVRVRAALGKIMVTVKDSASLNYPLPGSRQMLLYRKAIGSAKDGLNPELRKQLKDAPRAQSLKLADAAPAKAEAKTATSAAKPAVSWLGRDASKTVEEKTEEKQAFSRDDYIQAFRDKDVQADEDLVVITGDDDKLLLESGWELVTDSMQVVKKDELSAEDITEIFTNGLNPELVEMTPEQLDEYKKKKQEAEAAAKQKAAGAELAAAKDAVKLEAASKRVKPIAKKAEKKEKTADAGETEERACFQYVYVDENVKGNMIYRYAVLAAVRPRKPVEGTEVQKEDMKGWDIYCELEGVDNIGCFAPPQRELQGIIFTKPDKQDADEDETAMTLLGELPLEVYRDFKEITSARYQGVSGPHLLAYIEKAYEEGADKVAENKPADGEKKKDGEKEINVLENGPAAKSLRNDAHALLPRGWAYRNGEMCFADFVCSDIVLTPQEFDFTLVNAVAKNGDTPASVTIMIHKTEENGEIYQDRFKVNAPDLPRAVEWKEFVKQVDRKPVLPPQELSLIEVYNQEDLLKVKPASLGGVRTIKIKAATEGDGALADAGKATAVESKTIDFSSNWGVLDVRPYRVLQKQYRKNNKTKEWEFSQDVVLGTEYQSVVIGEIKAKAGEQRRVRRLFRPLPANKETASMRTVHQYIPEPGVYDWLKKQAGKSQTAAPAKVK